MQSILLKFSRTSFMKGFDKVLDTISKKAPQTPTKADFIRISLALKCQNLCNDLNQSHPTPTQVEKFHEEVDDMDDITMSEYIEERITNQVVKLFECIDTSHSYQNFKERAEFHLEVKESLLPSAGNGLFVVSHKSLLPGTVVALYPGVVHGFKEISDPSYINNLLPDEDLMLMARNDGCIIDGRTADTAPTNPYGFAQFINHCGDRHKPNCVQVTYNFPEDYLQKSSQFPKRLRKLIPNVYAKEQSFVDNANHYMKGIAFVSMRHIKSGDELLIDYHLNPGSSKLPSWYSHFDAEGAQDRWNVLINKQNEVIPPVQKPIGEI